MTLAVVLHTVECGCVIDQTAKGLVRFRPCSQAHRNLGAMTRTAHSEWVILSVESDG